MRISTVSSDGKVQLTFTNEMVFPANFTAMLNNRNDNEVLTVVSEVQAQARRLDEEAIQQEYLQLVMLR